MSIPVTVKSVYLAVYRLRGRVMVQSVKRGSPPGEAAEVEAAVTVLSLLGEALEDGSAAALAAVVDRWAKDTGLAPDLPPAPGGD